MFHLSLLCLLYIFAFLCFAFLCFVVLCFVIDPANMGKVIPLCNSFIDIVDVIV